MVKESAGNDAGKVRGDPDPLRENGGLRFVCAQPKERVLNEVTTSQELLVVSATPSFLTSFQSFPFRSSLLADALQISTTPISHYTTHFTLSPQSLHTHTYTRTAHRTREGSGHPQSSMSLKFKTWAALATFFASLRSTLRPSSRGEVLRLPTGTGRQCLTIFAFASSNVCPAK